jgi:predicted nucleic acid-binding protein
VAGFVLDCSVAVSWLIPDEKNSISLSVLEKVAEKGAIVPSIWHLEIGNVLLVTEHRGRITLEQRRSALHTLDELPIIIDTLTSHHAWQETIELAESYGLSLYDASYLELALRMNIPIATFDRQLKQAAHKRNVIIINEDTL